VAKHEKVWESVPKGEKSILKCAKSRESKRKSAKSWESMP